MFPFSLNNPYYNGSFLYSLSDQRYLQHFGNFSYSVLNQYSTCQLQKDLVDVSSREEKIGDLKNGIIMKQEPREIPNRKRLTKRLSFVCMKKELRQIPKSFKFLKTTFKYFTPSRAPPITTLRNQSELQADFLSQKKKCFDSNFADAALPSAEVKDIRKLQILIEQPSLENYPFLLCKKRRYNRWQKRRYSVVYFEKRASYILQNLPIPPELHPKYKNKKRKSNKSLSQQSDSSSSSFDDQSQCSQQYCKQQANENQDRKRRQNKQFAEKKEKLQNKILDSFCKSKSQNIQKGQPFL